MRDNVLELAHKGSELHSHIIQLMKVTRLIIWPSIPFHNEGVKDHKRLDNLINELFQQRNKIKVLYDQKCHELDDKIKVVNDQYYELHNKIRVLYDQCHELHNKIMVLYDQYFDLCNKKMVLEDQLSELDNKINVLEDQKSERSLYMQKH